MTRPTSPTTFANLAEYTEPDLYDLAAYRNVFLLLPSPNRGESLQILRKRDVEPPSDLNFDFNRHFLAHHGYYDLAKFTVYTQGRTPTETCAEIVALVDGNA